MMAEKAGVPDIYAKMTKLKSVSVLTVMVAFAEGLASVHPLPASPCMPWMLSTELTDVIAQFISVMLFLLVVTNHETGSRVIPCDLCSLWRGLEFERMT